jgi:NitT/TauT family transport system substrate-binding protein
MYQFLLVLAVGCALLAGCGKQPEPPLRIGIMEWSGFYPAAKAAADGAFSRAGVPTTVVSFPDNASLYQAFRKEEIEISAMVWTDAIRFASNGIDLQVLMPVDWSDQGDVILAAPGLTSPAALTGKRIACEGVHTFSHLFVLAFLAKHHLTESSLQFVDMPAADVPAALAAGTIDAGHTWGPLARAAIGTGCVVLDRAGAVPGAITEVYVVRKRLAKDRHDDLRRVVACLFAALPTTPMQATACRMAAAKALGKSPDTINPIGDEAHLLTATEARHLLTDEHDPQGLPASGERFLTLLAHRGQAPDPLALSTLLDPSLLPGP